MCELKVHQNFKIKPKFIETIKLRSLMLCFSKNLIAYELVIKLKGDRLAISFLKRAARIELASLAWKAKVLPLNYARTLY